MKRNACVFIGSDKGLREEYIEETKVLAKELVKANYNLVYGGAKVGLMGVLADSVLELGGEVIGIIPKGLVHKEIVHNNLTELKIVSSMHERKTIFSKLSSCYITLPGGIGTLEETCEAITWAQLGIHIKPCGFLNINGYFNRFFSFLDHMIKEGFYKSSHKSMLIVEDNPQVLLEKINSFKPKEYKRWMKCV